MCHLEDEWAIFQNWTELLFGERGSRGQARGISDCHSCFLGQKLRELYSCVTIKVRHTHLLIHSTAVMNELSI